MGMECPKCGYDIYEKYNAVCEGRKSKFVKITNYHYEFSLDAFNTYSWDVGCTCPKCKTSWFFSDSNY